MLRYDGGFISEIVKKMVVLFDAMGLYLAVMGGWLFSYRGLCVYAALSNWRRCEGEGGCPRIGMRWFVDCFYFFYWRCRVYFYVQGILIV